MTLAGYILGFPADTPETIRRDIAIIQKELPLDVLEFFCLTPLPGSEDHQVLWKNGVAMDADLNKYDVEHVCTAHPRMSRPEWEAIYREAWSLYYTPAHMKTLLRRAAATGVPMGSLVKMLLPFRDHASASKRCIRCRAASCASSIRRNAGPACRAKAPGAFWPRFVWETVVQARRAAEHARPPAVAEGGDRAIRTPNPTATSR